MSVPTKWIGPIVCPQPCEWTAELEAERNALRNQYESAVSVIKHFGEEGDEGDTLGNIVQRIIERQRAAQAIVDKLGDDELACDISQQCGHDISGCQSRYEGIQDYREDIRKAAKE